MQSKLINIYVISNDRIFIKLIEVMLKRYLNNPHPDTFYSFSEFREKPILSSPGFIIIDDYIIGASVLEIITFIRFNRRLTCPIYLFCENDTDLAIDSIKHGVNQYFVKPFNLETVANQILKNLNYEQRDVKNEK